MTPKPRPTRALPNKGQGVIGEASRWVAISAASTNSVFGFKNSESCDSFTVLDAIGKRVAALGTLRGFTHLMSPMLAKKPAAAPALMSP